MNDFEKEVLHRLGRIDNRLDGLEKGQKAIAEGVGLLVSVLVMQDDQITKMKLKEAASG